MNIDMEEYMDIMRKNITIARHAANYSRDPSTKCGAVITRSDGSFCTFGYNKFPENVNSYKEIWEDREQKMMRIIHAEESAILNARENLVGYKMYVTPIFCCSHCASVIIESGIKEVIFDNPVNGKLFIDRWKASQKCAQAMFKEAFVEVSYFVE